MMIEDVLSDRGRTILQIGVNMNILKTAVLTIALTAAAATTAHARDSFSIGINIGGHGYAPHSIVTHRHVPHYYGPPTVYYSAPRVVYYDAPVRYRHYQPYAYGGSYYGNGHHNYKHHGNHHYKNSRNHHSRSRGHHDGYGRR